MQNARLDEAQAGIKIAVRNISNLRYADDITLMAESKELKSLLMKMKESEKVGLNLTFRKVNHGTRSHYFMTNRWRNNGKWETLFWGGSKITSDGDCSHEIKRRLFLGRKAMTNLDSILKSRDITLLTKVHLLKAVFSSSHVWIWELHYKESWVPKNWCLWTVVLEKTLGSPLDSKDIQPIHPKGNQSWIFFGRTDFEAETSILWPPDAKNWLIWKDLDTRKDWRQEEKGMTEDEMDGWHHWLNGHEFNYIPGVGDE